MKCGIKCEIHDCTIELINLFEFEDIEKDFIKSLKDKRIQSQYYLKKIVFEDNNSVKGFINKCKLILENLNSTKINEIRDKLK